MPLAPRRHQPEFPGLPLPIHTMPRPTLSEALHAIAEGEPCLTLEREKRDPEPIDASRVLRFAAEAIQYPDFPMHGKITTGRSPINDVLLRLSEGVATQGDLQELTGFLVRVGFDAASVTTIKTALRNHFDITIRNRF